jgi:hypothetical protein
MIPDRDRRLPVSCALSMTSNNQSGVFIHSIEEIILAEHFSLYGSSVYQCKI